MKKKINMKRVMDEVTETVAAFIGISVMWGVIFYVAYISY